ncbi:MAG: PSD1 domain-containing protein [Verrucomicrobiaceae bacterium]|nr:PSD1 domain-containing protein [Verrucomicrobiaceae bacterium]
MCCQKLLPGILLACAAAQAADNAEALFVRRVWPLFQEKCLACHGQDEAKIKGEFDMRSLVAISRGGESGEPGLVAGAPDKSPIYLASKRDHDSWEPMPPKEADKLYAEQIEWIREWITAGAPWPNTAKMEAIAKANAEKWSAEDGIQIKTSGGLAGEWTNRRYKPESVWAYQPVKDVQATGIDELIARHAPKDSHPAAETDALTFLRRSTFDLTGLPPTPSDIEAFTGAWTTDKTVAIKSLIDRLLESPHYGERMAQHWLDVVRYADSSGFANDYERGNAWRYRDYVVRAFNADKPYDQFIIEQIAGDEMEPNDVEKLIATGFLRMGPWELTGMEVAKVARQRFLDDVTNSVGETFLAHSLQCARCHDHKFDPVPTRDYYSIQAVFATTQLAERSAPFLPVENQSGFEERAYLEKRRSEYTKTLSDLNKVLLKNAQEWFAKNGKDPSAWNAALKKPGGRAKGKPKEWDDSFDLARNKLTQQGIPETEFPPKLVGFTPEQFGMERVARKGLERLKWELDRYEPFALAVYNGRTPELKTVYAPMRMPQNRMTSGELEETCVLTGGDPFSPGSKVSPGVLTALTGGNTLDLRSEIEGRRLSFARWVADKSNPLTTRTIVNRIWMWHFGEPLAGNPNNFGSTGKKPVNPELLDWLAAKFVKNGWSFKSMHRLIMSSDAYRRSAEWKDSKMSREEAEKALLVFRPRRLSAEELRDSMLAASGELNRTLGGIPNRPDINLEAALQPRQVMGTFASAWVPNPKPEQRNRRSLYALKLRGLSDPAMEVFNAPAPDFSCERRDASTVTPQVFALFNSKASLARALALAKRVLSGKKDDAEAIRECFLLTYGREARPNEVAACLEHWKTMTAVQEKAQSETPKPPIKVRRDAVEENTGEKFSFDENLHAYQDFVPDLQPSDCNVRTRALADLCLVLLNSNEFAYVY